MEGNLRGARDLVAPLTAANLKRATSLGSANSPASLYATRGKTDLLERSAAARQTRTLHSQVSSPSMRRDYNQGHARNLSETELPERPHIVQARNTNFVKSGRIPVKPREASWTAGLRASKSFESTSTNVPPQATSLELNMVPLHENDASNIRENARDDVNTPQQHYHETERPTSTADGLREQMSSLKGKISSLKERAREDTLRRQSMNNLRTPSPLNNASTLR